MSGEDRREDTLRPQDAGALHQPGSVRGGSTEERTSVMTTQTAGGLAAGDPSGGPHRTPERRAFDDASGAEPQVESGRDPDLNPALEPVRAPEDIDATPPHGDKTLDH